MICSLIMTNCETSRLFVELLKWPGGRVWSLNKWNANSNRIVVVIIIININILTGSHNQCITGITAIMCYDDKAWARDLDGITERWRLVDGYITTSPEGEWMRIHTLIPELCNANQITGQIPSRFYVIPLGVNWSINIWIHHVNHNVTSIFGCLLLWFWITYRHSGYTCCHLHCCEGFTMHERWHVKLKIEIKKANQSDHVTYVWTWRRRKQMFHRAFRQFIRYKDAVAM